MNRPEFSKPKKTLLALAAILIILAAGAKAQEKLGDFVTEGGFDWMMGRWEATSDQGDKVELVYKLELDKHLATIQLKWPNYEYRGMIFYKPTEDKIVQIGVDIQGGNGKGTWDADGNKVVLKHEHTSADWQTSKMGFVHSKVDANTMKWEVYELYSSDELADYPSFTMEFKRQKKQTDKKAGNKSGSKEKADFIPVQELKVVR